MKAQITIAGVFHVGKVTKNDYGTQASVSEFGEAYPTTFVLALQDGQTMPEGKDVRLAVSARCDTFGAGTKRFTKYTVLDMKLQEVEVTVKDSKP